MDNTLYLLINVLIVLLLLIGFVLGWKKGLLYELCSFLLNFVVIFLAYKFSGSLATSVPIVNLDSINIDIKGLSLLNIDLSALVNQVIWFFIIFIGGKLIFFIISPLIKGFSKIPLLGSLNKLFGGFLGSINIVVVLIIISAILKITPINAQYQITNNTFLSYTDNITDWLSDIVSNKLVNSDNVSVDSSITKGVTNYLSTLDDEGYKNLSDYLSSLDEDDYTTFVMHVNSMSSVLDKDVVDYVNNLDEKGYKALLSIFRSMKNMDLNTFVTYINSLAK